jgi:hypothetical protein
MNKRVLAGTFGVLACVSTVSDAAVLTQSLPATLQGNLVQTAQYWRGGPYWRGPWRGPYWFHRPWWRRPYYGTIVAGVALGALITVAVVGRVPPRPAPNLCWYWADPYRNRGYWDYCY